MRCWPYPASQSRSPGRRHPPLATLLPSNALRPPYPSPNSRAPRSPTVLQFCKVAAYDKLECLRVALLPLALRSVGPKALDLISAHPSPLHIVTDIQGGPLRCRARRKSDDEEWLSSWNEIIRSTRS